jgi:P-type Cu+ transporter
MARDSMPAAAAQAVVDPVCGMTIDPAESVGTAQYQGQTYYFCTDACLQEFRADPAKYAAAHAPALVGGAAATAAPATVGVEYTCPMHPQIVRDRPGNCPICGMALEPRTITSPEEGEVNHELRDMTRRFWVGVVLSAPLLVIAMAHDLVGHLAPATTLRWAELALATRSCSGPAGRSSCAPGSRSSTAA